MNFNYSYKAFLITSLLVGNLILLLVSVKLNKRFVPEEETLSIEYAVIPEEELALAKEIEKVEIKTNTAYNEAEQFIREIENDRNGAYEEEDTPELEEYDITNSSNMDFSKAQEKLEEVKEKLAQSPAKKKTIRTQSVNRKTTISYRLVDRKAMDLPNPVYTCDAGGKIVISIEVNASGRVTKANYNQTLSTTTNGCLIDAALSYAQEARFNTKADKPEQMGTISYLFPGQE